jgi:hypothetical protein
VASNDLCNAKSRNHAVTSTRNLRASSRIRRKSRETGDIPELRHYPSKTEIFGECADDQLLGICTRESFEKFGESECTPINAGLCVHAFNAAFIRFTSSPACAESSFPAFHPTPSPAEPIRDDVKMHVHHCLMRHRTIVLKNVVGSRAGGGEHCASEPWQYAPNGSGTFIRELVEKCLRLFWDDEKMTFRERTNVKKREHMRVFVHAVAWKLASKDPAKNRHDVECSGRPLWKHAA